MAKNNIQKELKMDAKSILLRAPKIIIQNIDQTNMILPKDQIFINAFGVIDEIQNFDFIPPEIYQSLESLEYNQKILQGMVNANKKTNGNEIFTI